MIMTMENAKALAEEYWLKYNLGGKLNLETISYASGFFNCDEPVWLVRIDYEPSKNFDCMNDATIVISIDKAAVNHIVNRFGFDKYPHLE